MKTEQKETIVDLTNDLVSMKNQIKDGTVEMDVAKEFNNTAGKILNAVKVQLAQQVLILAFTARSMKVPVIKYLEGGK